MSTQAGTRLWRCGQDGGRLDLAQIHFPLFPCGNASHPPLRGTADQWVQDHREPRRANVRRRVHRWVGPLTARQHRCYSRTLGSRKSGGSHYPSSRVMRASPLARLLSVNGICASRSSASRFGNAAQSPGRVARADCLAGDVGVMLSVARYRQGQLARGARLARRSTEQPKDAPHPKPTTTTWAGMYKTEL